MGCFDGLDLPKLLGLLLRLAECFSELDKGTRAEIVGRATDTLLDLQGLACLKELLGRCSAEDKSRAFRLLALTAGDHVQAVRLESVFGTDETLRDATAWALKNGADKSQVEAVTRG